MWVKGCPSRQSLCGPQMNLLPVQGVPHLWHSDSWTCASQWTNDLERMKQTKILDEWTYFYLISLCFQFSFPMPMFFLFVLLLPRPLSPDLCLSSGVCHSLLLVLCQSGPQSGINCLPSSMVYSCLVYVFCFCFPVSLVILGFSSVLAHQHFAFFWFLNKVQVSF